MSVLASLKFNLAAAPVRHETLHGRRYLVAPMAMLTEGVHNGSGGPLLYRASECKKAVAAWNMKPIVVYHPTINGMGVTACDPDILEKQQVGMVMNARWAGGKLRAEAWIEEDRANIVDDRITDALDNNKMMEVSTGLFTDNTGTPGDWNGKAYTAEATNHQPDHLALLPDQIGACSIADGAGLLQTNAMSHGNLYTALGKALRAKQGGDDGMEGPWVVDVFDGYLIYDGMDGKLYKQTYTNAKDKVELTGEPYEVTRVTDYKAVKESILGNEAQKQPQNKERKMEKIAIVSALIANALGIFTEDEREDLMAMDEAKLEQTLDRVNTLAAKDKAAAPEVVVEAPAPPPVATPTTEEYIAAAPPEVREVLANAIALEKAQKAELITKITANAANTFHKDFLAAKPLAELQGLAALAAVPTAPVVNGRYGVPMFAGQATMNAAPVANAVIEESLPLPTMTFEPATA